LITSFINKLALFALVFYLYAVTLQAEHIAWQGDFDKAHKSALKENKLLMVLLLQKDDIRSKELISTAFTNKEYINLINAKFISVIVTKGQKGSYPIEMLYTSTYPTLFFLNHNELFICKPLQGEITPQRLRDHLKMCVK